MTIATIIALMVAIPVVLVPAALVWYINIGGIALALTETRERPVAGKPGIVKAK